MKDTEGITIDALTPVIGAEISGVDLRQGLDDAQFQAIHAALMRHQVVFFRNQQLSPAQHKAVGARFGPLEAHAFVSTAVEGHPEIYVLERDERSRPGHLGLRGGGWHADVTNAECPPMGAVLYMQEMPAGGGGDTLFASMYAAYDALSEEMQALLGRLTAVHDGRVYQQLDKRRDVEFPQAEHPVARTHPVTGRKALFVNQMFTSHIPQLTPFESESLLMMLFRHIETPRFHCRFRWAPGSVAIWDNRCTQHNPTYDYYPNRRLVHRVTIAGDRPR